ncbi:flagellar hook-associated protein FlgK [Paenarthrobacter sp. DKR-5]|uniref:flagellar hook-associated protein FlgK n=1 Tax=Paenarthrobacter sp. DKR-5 TaxID=2835535 RepID=UPI001BDBBEC3|nr:flagellar hook-associated protein FlgK [Paenarthrobacter sp. DKR-5]MBT1004462.1 flagellar hook-associated protein FlgK [Paenarthrobacter sp. DKR-5]
MSTFGGINTAFTGLSAARSGLDVAGQNVANANTAGYTRQRVETSSVPGPANVGLAAGSPKAGQGVSVDGIARLGDELLDNRVRSAAAQSGYASVRSDALSTIEAGLNEPGPNGISAQLNTFFSDWSGVANQPATDAPAVVLLQDSNVLLQKISTGYTALNNQWNATRSSVDTMASDLNTAASQIAALNRQIRSTRNAGGTANELIDQRSSLAATVAGLAGGTVRTNTDGTIDVVVGGNALVSGTTTRTVQAAGSGTMDGSAGSPVQLEWADKPGQAIALDGGRIAGALSLLAPFAADGSGSGGAIAEAAHSYDVFAQNLADTVNAVHAQGTTPGPPSATGQPFFAVTGPHAALGLSVVPTGASGLATGTGGGTYDGSNADRIAQLAGQAGGPAATWSTFVTGTGVAAKAAIAHGQLADNASAAAQQAQASAAGVDLDSENVDLLAYQRAYQASARVMTTIDQTLDTLINHTGTVGL